jgi:REP element-mobilizing transposase RayT
MLFGDERVAAILHEEWQTLTNRFPSIRLDAFIVMPNHVHFILWLTDSVGVPLAGAPTEVRTENEASRDDGAGASPAPTLGSIVGAYKSLVATRWLKWVKEQEQGSSGRMWQRNYYEHIVRNEYELNRIREYVIANPAMWNRDPENPVRVPEVSYDEAWAWLEGP